MKIGLIGAGNVGQFLLEAINIQGKVPGARVVRLLDERIEKGEKLQGICTQFNCNLDQSVSQFLQADLDLIVESTDPVSAKHYAPEVIKSHKDMLIISVGALVDRDFVQELTALCKQYEQKIHVPAGAIGGLDVLRAAQAMGELQEVSLKTRKPPQALNIQLEDGQEKVVFKGSADEAIKQFPKNINVAVTLSLAGLGSKRTEVQIIADPTVHNNVHEITVRGAFGEMKTTLYNKPMPQNPKTSYLAALSSLATLQNMSNPIVIG